ncbi:HAD family hydrolase [Dyadobacter sp. CY326]|uniref:HAD family hydrolase n=1 Tax=Dyadobacter sp. CY326 TaxID=2907300 RepID=UPI001F3B6249|nr:HAD family hydrolase [Dyadobacter sp. CY326]MCE7064224.1 HAD family hydrolase [Dyadobacter sp. CY326]
MIKGILFDYGGTIDTNGLHWANVLWESYQHNQVNIDREAFAEAYKYGEKALAIKPIIEPHHVFYDVLFLKVEQQFDFLRQKGFELNDEAIESIARECDLVARTNVEKAAPVLAKLAESYPLVMVSNFYGNINRVLQDFGISGYFQAVVESAVVGVRKPDPQIYQLGIEQLALPAQECVVVGDSYSKDIKPAKSLGCKTIWLNVKGWEDAGETKLEVSDADIEITDFAQIADTIRILG